MKIEKIHLRNFRNFADAEFRFPAQFTVLIGENGRGKSSLLKGVRAAVGDLVDRLGVFRPDLLINADDVRRIDLAHRFVPQTPSEINVEGELETDGKQVNWWIASQSPGSTFSTASPVGEYAHNLRFQTDQQLQEVDFPVLLYFSTARLWLERPAETELKTKGSKIIDGYAHCLDISRDKLTSLSWIKSNYYKSLKASSKGGEANGQLEAVLEAVATCVPGWTALEWDEDSDDLAGLYASGDEAPGLLPLRYLSDGLRTMAGMAAEIAYRCVILNGHHGRDAVRQSRGVVLIDELDMHLHPNWQRQVVGDLKRAFPNLQFVATTHSPFIVQALDSNELINLDEPTDLRPKDLSLEDVAEKVMGVDGPFGIENEAKEALSAEYLKLLEAPNDARREAALDEMEATISDPVLRAMLRMERLAKMGDEAPQS